MPKVIKNKIFITGAAGFLGEKIVQKFSEKDDFVYSFDKKNKKKNFKNTLYLKGDIANIKKYKKEINNSNIIIYAASLSRNHQSVYFPKLYYEQNIINLIKFLKLIKLPSNKYFYFISSIDVLKHKNYDELTPYIISKIACEKILIEYCKLKKIKVRIFRISSLFDVFNLDSFRFLSKISKLAKKNKKIYLDKNLKKLNYVNLDFVVNKIFESIKKPNHKKIIIFEIKNKKNISQRNIVQKLLNSLGYKRKPLYVNENINVKMNFKKIYQNKNISFVN
ncbi:MAG: hypothetical protein CL420_02100 [Acidimicrobiaceae bacterium]|nr:hypothetical protein [Acidimicrobiaceae bacterium]|tara:strand:+ start:195 stop:1028 length:834 start_codon:yes stop_codon:yes gene_type:complete